MNLRSIRQALFGNDRDVYDPRLFHRITVGALSAWVVMGGDLLGSCVYGPDVLAGQSGSVRSVLLVSGAATLVTLAILAVAYTRMVAHFPHGGGGYAAAKRVVSERLSLVSGVALVLDAAFNIGVSVVTCARAAADALPPAWSVARMPLALLLIAILTFVNLRGVKESVALLAPILVAFVGSHLLVLGLGVACRLDALPGVIDAVPREVRALAGQEGSLGALGTMARAYALGGAIYTGLESVSNGLPILREPKITTARRTMVLLAGIPALLLGTILLGYLVYDVRPEAGKTLNGVLFERVFAGDFADRPGLHVWMVTIPLLAEAALLIVSAQTGFVDGPRLLGALAVDRFLPRRLTRLNGRLAPAPGILVIASIAFAATLIVRGAIEPLVAVFVISVFVTFTISQWAMLRHAFNRRESGSGWRADAALHGVALTLCLVILVGTFVNWWKGALLALLLIALGVTLSLAIRRRYSAMAEAVQRAPEELAPSLDPPPPEVARSDVPPPPARDAPIAVLLLGERTEFGSLALQWFASVPSGIQGVILASVFLLDAEAVQSEAHLQELEGQRRSRLERVSEGAQKLGLSIAIELRRGADVLETATALVVELMRDRPAPSVVVGFRSALDSSAVDPLLRDDLAVRLQARLEREKILMIVVSIPLDA